MCQKKWWLSINLCHTKNFKMEEGGDDQNSLTTIPALEKSGYPNMEAFHEIGRNFVQSESQLSEQELLKLIIAKILELGFNETGINREDIRSEELSRIEDMLSKMLSQEGTGWKFYFDDLCRQREKNKISAWVRTLIRHYVEKRFIVDAFYYMNDDPKTREIEKLYGKSMSEVSIKEYFEGFIMDTVLKNFEKHLRFIKRFVTYDE